MESKKIVNGGSVYVFDGGAGNGSKDLGLRKNQLCPGCKSRLGMQLIRTNGYIHLFFVPVFRYGGAVFSGLPGLRPRL